ncbi:tyrosine-type recombinase/integrase [Aliiroseovarius sp. KMU-50]|uniref:Tyrosine-type recombinase/integrase n=1 Tax=Aliiroseovarius salicola TaxID=3009082 RepID=A0ABT4W143_9RHOB|nr:site-specific integrase [Aliiroseovarius sp. KMU-50]MDA5094229.1 tyrosine-type recombinase/integrase [Aliiroseovarius sp. KMU-50]
MHDLTDRFLRSLTPPETGRLEVSDTKRKGLRLRLSATGKSVWMYEKRVKGGPKRKHTLGSWPAVSLAQARAIALEIEAEASRGIDRVALEKARVLKEEAAKANRSTLQQVIDTYNELHLSQLRTGNERKRQLEAALQSKLNLPISELTHSDLQAAIDEKLLAGRKVFANRIRAALVAFTSWAWMRGYLDDHIGLRLAKPTKESARERVLNLEEVQAIYRTSYELGPLWGPLMRLLLLTGQRRGEIVGLRWDEIDLDATRITKAGSTTKNARPHITHLSAPALAELEALRGNRNGLVFTTTGITPVSGISRMKRRFDELLGEGFEPWRLHDFRTAMATALAEAGEPESVVDRILNHAATGSAPSAVARVYNQAEQLPQRARALERWADMVTGAQGTVVRIAQ